MRIKLPEFQVHKDNPFAGDALQRGESAEMLTRLILTLNEPFVLAVDSPWGTGKTTFLRMWMQQLSNSGYPCLFFNAWETDYNNDALIALMGEVEVGIGDINVGQKQKTKAKEQFTKAKKLGVSLVKRSIPTAIKIATSGMFDTSAAANQSLVELAEKIAKEEFDKYETRKNTIKKFKQKLSAFINELADHTNDNEHKPLIFFIDELDRCRPTYALEVLEKAKHLFNVNGIIFVLAIDKEQIGHSIRSVYGMGMDMDGYLRRFIDMDYRLLEPSLRNIYGRRSVRVAQSRFRARKI